MHGSNGTLSIYAPILRNVREDVIKAFITSPLEISTVFHLLTVIKAVPTLKTHCERSDLHVSDNSL